MSRVKLNFVNAAQVKSKPISWLWPHRIPRGMLSILAGPPDAGKTFISLWMTSILSRGDRWPDWNGPVSDPARTIYLSSEDAIDVTMKPRLDDMGADCDLVDFVAGVTIPRRTADGMVDEEGPFDLNEEHLGELERSIIEERPDTQLVVFDPMPGFTGSRDTDKEKAVRPIMQAIGRFAEKTGVAALGLMHLRKAETHFAIDRLRGSGAFGGVARAVWMAAPLPRDHAENTDGEVRAFTKAKLNIARAAPNGLYRIGDQGIEWLGTTTADSSDVLNEGSGPKPPGPKVQAASEWLKSHLAGGPKLTAEVMAAAAAAGHAERTIDRARALLGVVHVPPTSGKPHTMSLPSTA